MAPPQRPAGARIRSADMGRSPRRQAPSRRAAHVDADAVVRGPQAFGNGWPEYAHDWADLLAQQEADAEQKQRDQHEANRTRVRPPHLIRSGRSEYSQSMRNARWVYQGDIGLPLRFGRFQ